MIRYIHPCLTPLFILKLSDNWDPHITLVVLVFSTKIHGERCQILFQDL